MCVCVCVCVLRANGKKRGKKGKKYVSGERNGKKLGEEIHLHLGLLVKVLLVLDDL